AVVDTLRGILARLTAQERFEEAAVRRDQLLAYLRTAARAERLGPLRRARQILAARRREGGGWEILLLRYGRFAGTVLTPPCRSPMPAVARSEERRVGKECRARGSANGKHKMNVKQN